MNARHRPVALLIAFLLTATALGQPRSVVPTTDPDVDPLPRGAVVRLGTSRYRHDAVITDLAFAPDGERYAVSGGAFIGLHELDTGREIRRYQGGSSVAFTPDGRHMVGGWNVAGAWETETGRTVSRFTHSGARLELSPDGAHIAVTDVGSPTVRLIDPLTGKGFRQITCPTEIHRYKFSHDGRRLACATSETVHLWDHTSGAELASFKLRGCRSLAFVAGGGTLATASVDGKVRLWDAGTGQLVKVLAEQEADVWRVVSSRDGRRLAATLEDAVHVWDTATWARRRYCDAETCNVLAFSPDGKTLAVVAPGATVPRFLDLATGKERAPTHGHRGGIADLTFSQDGRVLHSVGNDGAAAAWAWRDGRSERCNQLRRAYGNHIRIAPDRQTVALAWHARGEFQFCDLEAGGTRYTLKAPSPLRTQVFSRDGRLLAWQGWQGKLHVWDVEAPTQRFQWDSPDSHDIAFSPDGSTLVFGEGLQDSVLSALHVMDLATGKERQRVELPGNVAAIRYSPAGRYVVTTTYDYGQGGELRLWDAERWEEVYSADWQQGYVEPRFSPDGRLLALPNMHRNHFLVIEVASGKPVHRFGGHRGGVHAAAFSPDHRVLATGDQASNILVWDLTGRLDLNEPDSLRRADRELKELWATLADDDAGRAQAAVWGLVAARERALRLLREQLRPIGAPDPQRMNVLIAALGSEDFGQRDQAMRELRALGELADPHLREALKARPLIEHRRRLEQLLTRRTLPLPAGQALRLLRAIQALEYLGSHDARAILRSLASGAPGASITRDAHAALMRLGDGPSAR